MLVDLNRPDIPAEVLAAIRGCDGCEAARTPRAFVCQYHEGWWDGYERLRADLATIAKHWPGKWTRHCVECDDEPWPCQTVLDVVVPWMDDEPDADGEADDAE